MFLTRLKCMGAMLVLLLLLFAASACGDALRITNIELGEFPDMIVYNVGEAEALDLSTGTLIVTTKSGEQSEYSITDMTYWTVTDNVDFARAGVYEAQINWMDSLVCRIPIQVLERESAMQSEPEGIGAEASGDVAQEHILCRIDYPLIEFGFARGHEWIVINRPEWERYGDDEMLQVISDGQGLQFASNTLSVWAFPNGRGTTPDGVIYVYKDGVLVKEVPYIDEVCFEDEMLKEMFEPKTRQAVEAMIQSELPSPI